ncbi:thiamine-phosphate kinase [Halarcobacter ebronensis]|uniref:Thiamine-monophosphate kinase n=1 Tax=Halarcobacter ebronensis TaxID=1462615 RepID=A0A4Q1AEF6_9BACT|nr:thiamine-phosphate kinase [Halarcobacter ebronensis]QKF81415.1 thiamine monophosphate kinase [Halarcobacter ebronensis]RXK01825.1 thiamine-phosphate kinase [Halarcobacter ebronensis]
MNKEDFFIKQFNKASKIIGDDGAVIDGFVYSNDAFFENIHFKKEWFSLKQIARKAMLVNISDAIAMNAKPKYALLTVAIPKEYSKKEIKELSLGFLEVAKEYDLEIIGGDTISNTKLDISITIISKTKKPKLRSGIKKDDYLCFTGTLGSCKKDLETLLNGGAISSSSKFIEPKLNAKFFYEVSKYINASMDISDGLFFELERMSKRSKKGFEFLYEIPKEVGCSGEEYELLFSFSPKYKEKIETIAKKYKVQLNIFAKAIDGKFKCDCKNHHFD